MEVLHHCKERRSKNMRAASPLLSFFSVTVLFTTADDYGTKYEDELHNTIYSNGTGSKYNKNINTASFVFILPGL